jgi:hypothetical protein
VESAPAPASRAGDGRFRRCRENQKIPYQWIVALNFAGSTNGEGAPSLRFLQGWELMVGD